MWFKNLRIYRLTNEIYFSTETLEQVLQGKNQTLAKQICTENFLPQASRFEQLDDMEWAFG